MDESAQGCAIILIVIIIVMFVYLTEISLIFLAILITFLICFFLWKISSRYTRFIRIWSVLLFITIPTLTAMFIFATTGTYGLNGPNNPIAKYFYSGQEYNGTDTTIIKFLRYDVVNLEQKCIQSRSNTTKYNNEIEQERGHLYVDYYVGMSEWSFNSINYGWKQKEYLGDSYSFWVPNRYEFSRNKDFMVNGIFDHHRLIGIMISPYHYSHTVEWSHEHHLTEEFSESSSFQDFTEAINITQNIATRFDLKYGHPHITITTDTSNVYMWTFNEKCIFVSADSTRNGINVKTIIYNPKMVKEKITDIVDKETKERLQKERELKEQQERENERLRQRRIEQRKQFVRDSLEESRKQEEERIIRHKSLNDI